LVVTRSASTTKRRNIFSNLYIIEVSIRKNLDDDFLSTPCTDTQNFLLLYSRMDHRKIKCCRSLILLLLYRYSMVLYICIYIYIYIYMIAHAFTLNNVSTARERAKHSKNPDRFPSTTLI